jgi:hypothetical protein
MFPHEPTSPNCPDTSIASNAWIADGRARRRGDPTRLPNLQIGRQAFHALLHEHRGRATADRRGAQPPGMTRYIPAVGG